MILESKYFSLLDMEGTTLITSDALGIVNAVVSNGMHKQQIVGARKILETRIPGRATPYFYGVDKSPLQFKISLATAEKYLNGEISHEGKSLEELNTIAGYFLSDAYRTIKFYIVGDEANSTVSYDFIVVGSPEIEYITNQSGKHGIISLNMRCNSFSGFKVKASTAESGTISNGYHESVYPNMTLKAIAAGRISYTSNVGGTIYFDNCAIDEEITIDLTTRIIESSAGLGRADLANTNSIYTDWSKTYCDIAPGNNTITAINCTVDLNWKEPKLL